MATTPQDLSPEQRQKIYKFVAGHPIGVLATVDTGGRPHASPIYVGVDKHLNIAFTTKRDTDKHENIQHHNAVMLTVFDAKSQTVVQLSGTAQEVTDLDEVQQTFHATLEAADQTAEDSVPPIAKISAGPYIAYRIVPDNVWMNEYGWGSSFRNALDSVNKAAESGDPA